MKTISVAKLFVVVCAFKIGSVASAGSFTVLHEFTNSTGGFPRPFLILSNNTLFGAANDGGTGGSGALFKIDTDGSNYTNFYNFSAVSNGYYVNSDGQYPVALILSSNQLYGATAERGPAGAGTVFRVNTDGSGFTNVYTFSVSSNGYYTGALAKSGSTLFITTAYGGTSGSGAMSRISTDGNNLTNLYNTGAQEMLATSNKLFWIPYTSFYSNGVYASPLFNVNFNGTGLTNLHSFISANGDGSPRGLIWFDGVIYGATLGGGTNRTGTIFKMKPDGSGFAILHSFGPTTTNVANPYSPFNGDGTSPGSLFIHSNILYGAAERGGNGANGTLFKMNLDGSSFETLYHFSLSTYVTNYNGLNRTITLTNADGMVPGGLQVSHGRLYGIAWSGGGGRAGTLFSLTLPPLLKQTVVNGKMKFEWDDPSFSLQGASILSGSWINIPGATSPYTNAVGGAPFFFRLQTD